MEPDAPHPNSNNAVPRSAQDTQKLSDSYAPPGVGTPPAGPYPTWHDDASNTAATATQPGASGQYGAHLGYVAPQQPSAATLLPADPRAVPTPAQPMPAVPYHQQQHVPPPRVGRPHATGAYGWAFSSYFGHVGVMFGHSVMPGLLFVGSHIAGFAAMFGFLEQIEASFSGGPSPTNQPDPVGLATIAVALGMASWVALWSFSLAVFNGGLHINAGYRPGFWSAVFQARWLNYWMQAVFFVLGCVVLLGVGFFRLPQLIETYTEPVVAWLLPFASATNELPEELLRLVLSSATLVAVPLLVVAMATWFLPVAILSGDANCLTGIFRSLYIGFRYPWLTFCLIVFAVFLHALAGLLCFVPTLCLVVPVVWLATTRAYCQVTGR